MTNPQNSVSQLLADVRTCRVCAAALPLGPRPIVQFGATSRIVIVGQAPGTKVHASGVPWADDSGDRLRQWTGLTAHEFYDPAKVALVPMGFCYPGKGEGGDLPPRPECAPLWHERITALLPANRLTLLVGTYAQKHYLPDARRRTMTDLVRAFDTMPAGFLPLPHPAWRSQIWMRRNPWFEADVLPVLRETVRLALG